jgi:hypothetical protein
LLPGTRRIGSQVCFIAVERHGIADVRDMCVGLADHHRNASR